MKVRSRTMGPLGSFVCLIRALSPQHHSEKHSLILAVEKALLKGTDGTQDGRPLLT